MGSITMATTTSTYDSGLLDYLNPIFTKKTGIDVRVVSMGTGAAFRAGMEGNADLLLIHDKAAEIEFVKSGYGTERRDVMYNDFVILGPSENPADLLPGDTAVEAFKKIAETKSTFISRGDDSGTHRREELIWSATGLPLDETEQTVVKEGNAMVFKMARPTGDWYLSIGQGMGPALTMANEKQAYILADRGTYLSYMSKLNLVVLNEGDPILLNQYGVIPINPEKFPHVKYNLAMEYVNWITSPEGQEAIRQFKVGDEILFHPDYKKEES